MKADPLSMHNTSNADFVPSTWSRPGISRAAMVFSLTMGAVLPSIFFGRAVLAILLILALLSYALMRERSIAFSHLQSIKSHTHVILVTIVLISWIPQLFGTIDLWKSTEAIVRSGLLVLIATILWSGLHGDRERLSISLKAFLVASIIVLIPALVSLMAVPELYALLHTDGWVRLDVRGGLKSEASSGALMIPLALLASWSLSGKWRWVGILIAFAFLAIVFLTVNRSSVGGIAGAIVIAGIVIAPTLKNRLIAAIVMLTVVGAVAASFAWVSYSRYGQVMPSGDIEGFALKMIDWHRQEIWRHAWSLGTDARWFGTGANVINLLPGADVQIGDTTASKMPLHPHNWVVEILIETGYIGFVTLLGAMTLACFRFIRDFWRYNEPCLLAVICVWVIYWTSGLFNFSYWSAWWQATFYVATALCLAGKRNPPDNQTSALP